MATEANPGDSERDSALAALYRSTASDEPSSDVDDAIRAAARRAVSAAPRRLEHVFKRSWRVPLSVAALVVLSVSVVTLMRDEAPEVMRPETGTPSSAAVEEQTLRADRPSSVPEASRSLESGSERNSGLGLKPSSGSGQGLKREAQTSGSISPYKEQAPEGRRQMEPFGGASAQRTYPGSIENKTAVRPDAPAENVRDRLDTMSRPQPAPAAPKASESDASVAEGLRARVAAPPAATTTPAPAQPPAPVAASASSESSDSKLLKKQESDLATDVARQAAAPMRQAAPAPPVAKPAPRPPLADASPAPAKWLEQIIELRKQGRLEEARTSFGEFRKRYPDYPLPPALRDWAQP